VTILYPFVPAARLVPAVRQVLAEIARKVEPFDVRFEGVGRFPSVVYLAPDPAAPFSGLTRAIHARFPDYPPYEGVFAEVVPHLTITETLDPAVDETMLESVAAEATRDLPFTVVIDRLEVLVEGLDGHWRGGWRLPLGAERP
jgi:2'-5' RNA ligase